jgi:hypothetical protein
MYDKREKLDSVKSNINASVKSRHSYLRDKKAKDGTFKSLRSSMGFNSQQNAVSLTVYARMKEQNDKQEPSLVSKLGIRELDQRVIRHSTIKNLVDTSKIDISPTKNAINKKLISNTSSMSTERKYYKKSKRNNSN